MARLPRYAISNQLQHIVQRGRDGQQIFFADQDYQYFHECLGAAAYNCRFSLHAYVLMPDHVHVLGTPADTDSVARTVQSLGRNYVQYFNECYQGSGSLWEGRYRATVVDAGKWMLTCSRYIELNPVRAGLVKSPSGYRWSSYAHNATTQKDEMLSAHREYLKLGATDRERSRAYRALFKRKLDADTVHLITESTLKGWALGDPAFVRRIEKLSGRRARQLPRGRRKKA